MDGYINPYKYDDDSVAVYSSAQINAFGLPETWGCLNYRVIQLEQDEKPLVMDWCMEQDRKLRPIHRYNRVERFQSILLRLVGERGDIPKELLDDIYMHEYEIDIRRTEIWNSFRKILKKYGWRKYYNSIGLLISIFASKHLQERQVIIFDSGMIGKVMNHFKEIHNKFEEIKGDLDRKYFPNLRFIALKLLIVHGAGFDYDIPLVRTLRKQKPLQEIWELLVY